MICSHDGNYPTMRKTTMKGIRYPPSNVPRCFITRGDPSAIYNNDALYLAVNISMACFHKGSKTTYITNQNKPKTTWPNTL